MWYQRGSLGSFNIWAKNVGDSSFTWANLLPYWTKSAKFTPPSSSRTANATAKINSTVWSSSGGPLQVSYPNYVSAGPTYTAKAFQQLGFNETTGFYDGNMLGWSYTALTIDPASEVRSSSDYFLGDALVNAPNLVVYPSTLVKKVLFNSAKQAIGVQVQNDIAYGGSVTYTINATKEVILSAGSFRSPQLLMVSGIGPAATLNSLSIPVLANRPGVGQQMWDNVIFGVTYQVDVQTHSALANPATLATASQQFIQSQTGLLTNPGNDLLCK